MGFMDGFTSDGTVDMKHTEYYNLMKEAAKAELLSNAVKAEVPGFYIQAMITGEKPEFLNELKAEEEDTGFHAEYEQITGAVVSIFEAWQKENGVESAAASLHRLIDTLELNRITKKRRSDIYIKEFNTSVKKIAFNSKKSDGFNPQMVVNDEMEAWQGDQGLKQYEVMTSALGARKQPLILSISTAGYINDGIYDELMRRSTSFLKGNSKETRILPFLYMIDNIEAWDDLEELKKSNPNLGVSVSEEFYIEQIEIAKASLSKKVEFLTKYCNIKQNSSVAWLDYWDVMKAVNEDLRLTLEQFRGCYCVGGIDLSRTTDLTAASIVIWKNGKWNVITKFYMPKKRYEVAVNEDNTPYNIYKEKGFLQISGENQVDYKDVYNWFIELVKVYKIRPLKIGYDRYSAGYLVDDLKMAGFQTDDVYQGTNLTPILHQFEGDLKDGKYNLGDNTLLASHLLNVAVEINMNDSRMKPVKIEKRMRIDGAVSVFDAMTMVSKYHSEIGKKLLNEAA